jgi:hypothetical protein
MNITRHQIEFCFKQATQGGRFSPGYCVDRILELVNTDSTGASGAPSSEAGVRLDEAPALDDKDGWVYDPDAKLKRIRESMKFTFTLEEITTALDCASEGRPNWQGVKPDLLGNQLVRVVRRKLERTLAEMPPAAPLREFLQAEITEHQRQNGYADMAGVSYNVNLGYIDGYRLVLAFIEGNPTWERGAAVQNSGGDRAMAGARLLEKLADSWIRTGQLGEGLRTDEYVTKHKEAIMGIYEYCGKTLTEYLRHEALAANESTPLVGPEAGGSSPAQGCAPYTAEYIRGYNDGCTDARENTLRELAGGSSPALPAKWLYVNGKEVNADSIAKWFFQVDDKRQGECRQLVDAAIEAARREPSLTNPNGSFTKQVIDEVLVPGPCGVSGHFRFQMNGNSCIMCQRESELVRETRRECADGKA